MHIPSSLTTVMGLVVPPFRKFLPNSPQTTNPPRHHSDSVLEPAGYTVFSRFNTFHYSNAMAAATVGKLFSEQFAGRVETAVKRKQVTAFILNESMSSREILDMLGYHRAVIAGAHFFELIQPRRHQQRIIQPGDRVPRIMISFLAGDDGIFAVMPVWCDGVTVVKTTDEHCTDFVSQPRGWHLLAHPADSPLKWAVDTGVVSYC